jgi:hypothetical protein
MPTAKSHRFLIAQIDEIWHLRIDEVANEWIVSLRKRTDGNNETSIAVGNWPSLLEAKELGGEKAREILQPVGLKVPPLVWKRSLTRTQTSQESVGTRTVIWTTWVAVLTGIAGIVAAISPSSSYFGNKSQTLVDDKLVKELDAQRKELDTLSKALVQPSNSIELPTAIIAMGNDIAAIKAKMSDYEAAVGDEPAKRLAIPIIRKDLDVLKDAEKQDITAIHDQVSQTFDLMKWLLGLLGIANLSTVIPAFFSKKPKEA